MGGAGASDVGLSDPIISRIAREDPIPWYKKPNLRFLYFMLFPTCMGIELTSGFDSQMINALQILKPWDDCKFLPRPGPGGVVVVLLLVLLLLYGGG